jgi:hypothetical protein
MAQPSDSTNPPLVCSKERNCRTCAGAIFVCRASRRLSNPLWPTTPATRSLPPTLRRDSWHYCRISARAAPLPKCILAGAPNLYRFVPKPPCYCPRSETARTAFSLDRAWQRSTPITHDKVTRRRPARAGPSRLVCKDDHNPLAPLTSASLHGHIRIDFLSVRPGLYVAGDAPVNRKAPLATLFSLYLGGLCSILHVPSIRSGSMFPALDMSKSGITGWEVVATKRIYIVGFAASKPSRCVTSQCCTSRSATSASILQGLSVANICSPGFGVAFEMP